MKSIKEQMLLLKESFDAVGTKLNGLTWQRIEKSHLEFSQSQTHELQEQNSELVANIQLLLQSLDYDALGVMSELIIEDLKQLLTKHNHLKSNTNG